MPNANILSDDDLKKLIPAYFARNWNNSFLNFLVDKVYIERVKDKIRIAEMSKKYNCFTLGNASYHPKDKKNIFFGERIAELNTLIMNKANTTIGYKFIIYYACYIGYQNPNLVNSINRYFKNNGKKTNAESLLKEYLKLEKAINETFERLQALGLDVKNPIPDLMAIDTSLPFFEFVRQLYATIGNYSVPHLVKVIAYSRSGKWTDNDWDYYLDLSNKKQF